MKRNQTIPTATSGRISPKIRKALVNPVREFATAENLKFNHVMAAVLWTAERLNRAPGFEAKREDGSTARLCPATIRRLINRDSVTRYEAELARRSQERDRQIRGMVTKALPYMARRPEVIAEIEHQLDRNASIPTIKSKIEYLVAQMAVARSQGAQPACA